jgi:large repetitive protein
LTGVLTLSGADTLANYQAAIESVTYLNTSEDPSADTRTVSLQVDDGQAANHASNTVTRDVGVTPVNDPPVVTGGGTLAYGENDTAKVVDNTIRLSDAENDSLTGAHVTISTNHQAAEDVLSFTPTGNITGSFDASSGVLTLSGADTAAQYEAALRSVSYENTSDNPSTSARTITFDVTDVHGDTGAAASSTVTVAAVNDAPVNILPADAAVGTAFSNTAMAIGGVAVSDVDAGDGTMTVHVTVANGSATFSLAGGSGVSAGANGSGDVTLSGSASQLNAALATLSYKSHDGFTGIDTISVVTNDGGNTGSGGAKSDSGSIHVGVVPQVFVIDNTDATADSASAGTASNPFNSVASFNALAPHGNGDFIYVMKGSGTYSEASGFTLKNNEHVYGQGQTLQFVNPVTGEIVTVGTGSAGDAPVISITGAGQAGVTLAQGNTLEGFDIATTGGGQIGMRDIGASVGALTVRDVSITGKGMAVDIGHGGTLDVVLDKLTSTAAAEGVKLAGGLLSGSFSVSDTSSSISGSSVAGFHVGDGLSGSGGTFSVNYGGTISTTGTASTLQIEDRPFGAGALNFSGDLTHSAGNGYGVFIDSISGGAITLSGNDTLDTGTSAAVSIGGVMGGSVTLSGNQDIHTTSGAGISTSGGTQPINFTGSQITINTTTGTGISSAYQGTTTFDNSGGGLHIVTSGGTGITGTAGTLVIMGSGNTITANNGTAVNLANTTIGAPGLNFQSISSSGAANGIVLDNTGSLGSLVVTGTGLANSGGTISGTTGDGISVTSGAIRLAYMLVLNVAGNGINLANLLRTDNTFNDGTVTGFGSSGGQTADAVHWVNTGSNDGALTVSNSTISNGAGGNDGIFAEAQDSGAMALTVSGSAFFDLFGDAIQVNGITGATGTQRVTIQNSTFQNAVAGTGNGGISLNPFGDVAFFADVNNNQFNSVMNPVTTLGAIGVTNGGTAHADITLRNNTIDHIAGGRGITVTADGGTTDLLIDNNSVDNLGSTSKSAINVNFINNSTLATSGAGNVTVSNNDIGQHGATAGNLWTSGNGTANAILLQALNGASMTAAVTDNVVDANTTSVIEVVRLRAAATSGFGGGTISATVSGNDLQDTETTTHVEFDATAGTSTLGGTVNLSISGNTLPGSGAGVIKLTENAGGAINVTQASASAVSTADNGATVTATGSPTYGAASPAIPSTPSLPLLATGTNSADGGTHDAHAITTLELASAAAAAANRWAQLPLSQAQLDTLSNLTFAVGFLSGGEVGTQAPGLIVLDNDADGIGWNVDASPMDDLEFAGAGTLLHANTADAATQVDLLTVVMHEMGHALGLSDLYGAGDSGDIMYGYIEAGERRLPAEHDVAVTLVGTPYEVGAGP